MGRPGLSCHALLIRDHFPCKSFSTSQLVTHGIFHGRIDETVGHAMSDGLEIARIKLVHSRFADSRDEAMLRSNLKVLVVRSRRPLGTLGVQTLDPSPFLRYETHRQSKQASPHLVESDAVLSSPRPRSSNPSTLRRRIYSWALRCALSLPSLRVLHLDTRHRLRNRNRWSRKTLSFRRSPMHRSLARLTDW